MYQLFREFRGFRATDPRDKVYALVGLAENVEYTLGPLPVIAYSPDITVFDVVWNILAVEIRNNRSLAFLSDACGIKKPEGFASWMPLWDDQVPPPLTVIGKPTKLLGLQMGHVIYKASGATQTAVQIVKDDKLLAVTGAKCAVVTDIGDVFDRDLPAMNRLAARKKWALMLGVDALDLLAHVLTSLQIVGYFSEKEAELRWALSAKKHTQKQKLLYERFFATIMGSASSEGTRYLIHLPREAVSQKNLEHFTHQLENNVNGRIADVCHGRRFFTCSPRWGVEEGGDHIEFGLCPSNARAGDIIAMFFGSAVLHVIRPMGADCDGNPIYGLVGEAYVHSWMRGQLLEKMSDAMNPQQLRATEIRLQ